MGRPTQSPSGQAHRKEFHVLRQVVKALGQALGDRCEVVLHDLRTPESSIIAIEHGEITGRKVGDPSTNLGMAVLQDPYGDHDQFNYRSRTRTGRVLKSSSVYFRDESGRIFAALCLNWDISELEAVVQILQRLTQTADAVDEQCVRDVDELVNHFVDEALAVVGKPVPAMDRTEKLRVVQWLAERGVFGVRGTMDRVAGLLGISKATLYAYLNELESQRANRMV